MAKDFVHPYVHPKTEDFVRQVKTIQDNDLHQWPENKRKPRRP